MPPTLVIFSLEGTLVDCLAATRQAAEHAFLRTFGHAGPIQVVPSAGRLDTQVLTDLRGHAQGPASGEAADARLHQAYVEAFPGALARKGALLLPGVTALLGALAADPRCRLALTAESCETVARAKLQHVGLGGFFATAAYAEPGTADATAVMRQAAGDSDPSHGVVITAYPMGLQAARALGMRCIGVGTGQGGAAPLAEARADAVFPDLTDLPRVVGWLLG